MAATQADLDAWDQAILDSRGALSITFNDQTVSFASLKDRQDYRAFLVRQINADTTPPYRLAVTRKVT